MKLDKTTFGKTPAALYLADYLNKLEQPLVTKRTGKILTGFRNTFTQLEKANNVGILTAHNLARVIGSMRENFFVDVGDELASNLVTNILVGEMKILLRKSSNIRKIESFQKRIVGKKEPGEFFNHSGYRVAKIDENSVELPKYTVEQLTDNINAETLTEKWKIKMKRRNIEIK